jgi:GNAT superfamily N-acetyltransferase
MMESVRLAVPEDADACASLCQAALSELSALRGGNLFARRETGLVAKALLRPGGLRRLLSDSSRLVAVGSLDEVVVGMAVARAESVGESLLGVVDGFFVQPEARGIGVGKVMLDSVTTWMASKGCKAVDAGALPGARETKSFFESAGFKARLITMHKELP